MPTQMRPVRAVLAALAGGVAGGVVLGAVAGYGAEALLEPQAGLGLAALVYAFFGFVAGATLGACAAVALAFRGPDGRGARTTALTTLATGVLWGLLWLWEPALLWAGVVLLPLGALLGRRLASR